MNHIFLTDKSTAHHGSLMVNADSLTLVRQVHSNFGDEYAEIYIGNDKIDVVEKYDEVITIMKEAGVL